jgi:ABC-2 type transport system permease protein
VAEADVNTVLTAARGYRDIAFMWVRASLAYRTSFWMMAVSNFVIGGLDFVGIWIMFSAVDSLGGYSLGEIALLYGVTGLGLSIADMVVGQVERIGQLIRMGRLDTMMVRPVPLLVQVCANEFALRRIARVVQTGILFAVGCSFVTWSPTKVLVAGAMVCSGAVIFFAVFVGFACIQFWTADSSDVANAFTYGGNTITQYPPTIFPKELLATLTFLFPLAFVNWYPCLYLLDRPDPLGLPTWVPFISPAVAVVMLTCAAVVWRSGVRHYNSTGS